MIISSTHRKGQGQGVFGLVMDGGELDAWRSAGNVTRTGSGQSFPRERSPKSPVSPDGKVDFTVSFL